MTQRPFDTGRHDALGRKIKPSGAAGAGRREFSAPAPADPDQVTTSEAAVADDLREGRHLVDLAARFVDRHSHEEFVADELVRYGGFMIVVRLREVVIRLPQSFKDSRPEIPWRQIVGMGNVLAHQHPVGIDADLVWDTMVFRFPKLTIFDDG